MSQSSRRLSPIVILALLAALFSVPSATAAPSLFGAGLSGALPEGKGPVPDRYIVVLEDSVERPGRVAQRHAENRGAQVRHVYRSALKGYAARISKGELAALKADPAVAYVERDYYGGIASQEVPTGIDRIFATANKALAINEEDDLRVDANIAILDTGVAEHPDLDLVSHVNCSGQPCAEGGTDGHGHGTHVAGTAAAIDNEYGVVGVAPGARVVGVQVLSSGGFGELSEFIAGIDWITATREDEDPDNDIDVANSSLRYWFVEESEAFEQAIETSMDAGVVHVAAAGNESEPVRYVPGNHPDVITVSALADFDGKPGEGKDPLAWFSNYGPLIDVAAPGVDILSTVPWEPGYEGGWSGTSMASPHVAGAAAILAANEKPESVEDVEAIRDTIVEEGNFDWVDTSPDGIQEPLLDVGNEVVFSISAVPSATTDEATEVTTSTATLNARVAPRGLETTYQFEYGTDTEYGSKVPIPAGILGGEEEEAEEEFTEEMFGGSTNGEFGNVELSEPVEGLEPGITYHFRVVATNEAGTAYGQDRTFKTVEKPTVSTQSVTWSNMTSAVLKGTVNPKAATTTYQFEYGKTTSYGSKVPASPQGVGSGTSLIEVQQLASNLEAGTTYHYRIVATNEKGTSHGADLQFATKPPLEPSVANPFVTVLGEEEVELKASVNPRGAATTYQFEYGKTAAYGSKAPASPEAIGSGTSTVKVSKLLEGLEFAETYHVRVAATNSVGTTYSEDKTFTVSAIPQLAFAYEFEPQLYDPPTSWMNTPMAVAVDPEGDVWVGDDQVMEAQKFDGEGNYLKTVGTQLPDNGEQVRYIAVDDEGNLYVGQPDLGMIQKYDSEGEELIEIGGGQGTGDGEFYSGVQGVAIDAGGNIWAVDSDGGRVHQFNAEGEYISHIEVGSVGRLNGVAVDPDGDIWVTGNHVFRKYAIDGELLSEMDPTGWHSSIAVDHTGVIWVAGSSSSGCTILAFGEEGEQLAERGTCAGEGPEVLGGQFGLTVDAQGNLWVTGSEIDKVRKWERSFPPTAPEAVTEPAIEVGKERAIMKASVNPNGAAATYQFEYGETTAYGSKAPASPKAIGSGTSALEVSKLLEGLDSDTTYHYRVAATNEVGTSHGVDQTFTTPTEEVGVWLAGEGSEVEAEQPRFETINNGAYWIHGWGDQLTIDLDDFECTDLNFSTSGMNPTSILPLTYAEHSGCSNVMAGVEYSYVSKVVNSCDYGFGVQNAGPPYTGTFGIACWKEGDRIELKAEGGKAPQSTCRINLEPQEVGGVEFANVGGALERKIEVVADVEGIEYEIEGPCVEEPEIRTDGTLIGEMLLVGEEE